MSLKVIPYGITSEGEAVEAIILEADGLTATILTYGGAIASLMVPDREGEPVDVVLGCADMAEWESHGCFFNAIIGRCGNRIAQGKFTLDGEDYTLAVNNGPNCLHGGDVGFDKRLWTIRERGEDFVTLHLDSLHMEEGFPGNLTVNVTYGLEEGALIINYVAFADQKTICNLTNHAYFNLGGHTSGDILGHTLQLNATHYTPADETSIPTGELAPVSGTPMDFTTPTAIGSRIEADFQQLHFGQGYDHNWVLNGEAGTMRQGAVAYCEETGIAMEMETTSPAVQFYTGNFVTDTIRGKDGATYGRRHAFCLETQYVPDAIHHPQFAQPVLDADGVYEETTIYRFSCK